MRNLPSTFFGPRPRPQLRIRMDYYRRFPGDYARDTQHLTTFEHGIYTLLLDHLYATERPIPSLQTAYRIARVLGPMRTHANASRKGGSEKAACAAILKDFFIKTENGYWHKRVDEELKYAKSKSNKARQSAKARWKYESDGNANAMRTHSERNAIPDNQTTRQPDTSPSASVSEGFEVETSQGFASNGDHTKVTRKREISPAWENLRIPKVKH